MVVSPPAAVDGAEKKSWTRPSPARSPQSDFMFPTTRSTASPGAKANGVGVQVEDTKICVVMVGLPARGKSLIAQKGEIMHKTAVTCEELLMMSS